MGDGRKNSCLEESYAFPNATPRKKGQQANYSNQFFVFQEDFGTKNKFFAALPEERDSINDSRGVNDNFAGVVDAGD